MQITHEYIQEKFVRNDIGWAYLEEGRTTIGHCAITEDGQVAAVMVETDFPLNSYEDDEGGDLHLLYVSGDEIKSQMIGYPGQYVLGQSHLILHPQA